MKYVNYKEIKNQLNGSYVREDNFFNFLCHNKLYCFNKCCRNVNIFLYPYDVLRLKNKLKKRSSSFIDNYLNIVLREKNSFPEVFLRMNKKNDMKCPFLKKDGCSVYYDRPYSCRTFPIEMGILTKSCATINLFKPPIFCGGKLEKNKWKITDWGKSQQTEMYQKMTINWSSIKKMFYAKKIANTSNKKIKMAFISVYNLDEFRKFVLNSSFFKRYKVRENFLNRIKKSDIMLLYLGFEWIKVYMWGLKSQIIKQKEY